MGELDPKILRNDLQPHSNFSYMIVNNERWIDAKVNNSLFNGSIFNDCTFENVLFPNSDFEGTRFIKCFFYNCCFTSADIHSNWIANTIFQNSIFDDTIITDSNFIQNTFKNCSFNGLVMTQSVFEKCEIDSFSPQDSSFNLNKYIETVFYNAFFDKVFYYQFFTNCKFINSTFEAYLLGHTYGLSEENYRELKFLLMGANIDCGLSDLFSQVIQIYNDRKMFLNLGFLMLEMPDSNIDGILIECILFIEKMLKHDVLIKTEQIQFIEWIIDDLNTKKTVAPAAILIMEHKLTKLFEELELIKSTAWIKAKKDLFILGNKLHFLFMPYLDIIHNGQIKENKKIPIVLKFTFNNEPSIKTTDLLHELAPHLLPPVNIKTSKGSFIEWISSVDSIVKCIELFLILIGSIAVPIYYNRKEKNNSSNKNKIDKDNNNIRIQNNISISNIYHQTLTSEIEGSLITSMNVIINHQILNNTDKCGFSSNNLCNIEVSFNTKASPSIE